MAETIVNIRSFEDVIIDVAESGGRVWDNTFDQSFGPLIGSTIGTPVNVKEFDNMVIIVPG